MALVLRKAVLTKNVSLLKCIKGRQLATTNNKKHAAPIFTTVQQRGFTSKSFSPVLKNIRRSKLPSLPSSKRIAPNLGLSTSCPNIAIQGKMAAPISLVRRFSSTAYSITRTDKADLLRAMSNVTLRKYSSKPCAAPCPPIPCGPCCKKGCCLPPPCNTPPQCIQYMTGYYYYPYGTWFCGPYHVASACLPAGAKCPCPKCCAACVCSVPKPEPAKADKTMDKYKVTTAEATPAEPSWDVLAKTQEKKGESKLKNKSDKTGPDSTKKIFPPVLASILHPFSQSKTMRGAETSYPMYYPKTKSNSYHTQVDPMDSIYRNKSAHQKQRIDRILFNERNLRSSGERNISYREKRGRRFDKLRLYNHSTVPRYLKANRKPRVKPDFEQYDL